MRSKVCTMVSMAAFCTLVVGCMTSSPLPTKTRGEESTGKRYSLLSANSPNGWVVGANDSAELEVGKGKPYIIPSAGTGSFVLFANEIRKENLDNARIGYELFGYRLNSSSLKYSDTVRIDDVCYGCPDASQLSNFSGGTGYLGADFGGVNKNLVIYNTDQGTKAKLAGLTLQHRTTLSQEFHIHDENIAHISAIAYPSGGSKAMLVWQDKTNDSAGDIHGLLISSDGSSITVGAEFIVADAKHADGSPAQQIYPSIAYNSNHDQFTVLWTDNRNTDDTTYKVYGRTFLPSDFNASNELQTGAVNREHSVLNGTGIGYTSPGARLSYNSGAQRYLLIKQSPVYGHFLKVDPNDSTRLVEDGPHFRIALGNAPQTGAEVVSNSTSAPYTFLVTWLDRRTALSDATDGYDNDAYGRVIPADAAFTGNCISTDCIEAAYPSNEFFAIEENENTQRLITAAYIPGQQKYLVAYSESQPYSWLGLVLNRGEILYNHVRAN